jgi:hypothetical protein
MSEDEPDVSPSEQRGGCREPDLEDAGAGPRQVDLESAQESQ